MNPDPIVEEVRRVRQEYAKRFDYNLRALAADLRRHEKQHADRVVSFPPRRVCRTRKA